MRQNKKEYKLTTETTTEMRNLVIADHKKDVDAIADRCMVIVETYFDDSVKAPVEKAFIAERAATLLWHKLRAKHASAFVGREQATLFKTIESLREDNKRLRESVTDLLNNRNGPELTVTARGAGGAGGNGGEPPVMTVTYGEREVTQPKRRTRRKTKGRK